MRHQNMSVTFAGIKISKYLLNTNFLSITGNRIKSIVNRKMLNRNDAVQ